MAFQNQTVGGRQVQNVQRFTPEQMQLYNQMFTHVGPGSDLSRMASGDPRYYQDFTNQAMRDFSSTMGGMASRFSGMGSGGRHSSGFQLAGSQEASSLAEKLAMQRNQMQMNAMQQLMSMSNTLLGQQPYEQFAVKPQEQTPMWQKVLGGVAPVAGGAIGTYFGGPAGGTMGYNIGSAFAEAFK